MADYIKDIRNKVGHEPIILNFAGGILVNQANQVLLQKHSDLNQWGLPGGALEFGETAEGACPIHHCRRSRDGTALRSKDKLLLDSPKCG